MLNGLTKRNYQQRKYESYKQLPADRVLTDSTLDNQSSIYGYKLGLNKVR
jgi:hypothetical protein